MTHKQAIKEAMKISTTGNASLDMSTHCKDGKHDFTFYSIYLDDFTVIASCKDSWQECIDCLRDPGTRTVALGGL